MIYCDLQTCTRRLSCIELHSFALLHIVAIWTHDISLCIWSCRARLCASLQFRLRCTNTGVLMLMICASGVGHTALLLLITSQSCATSCSPKSLPAGMMLCCISSDLCCLCMMALLHCSAPRHDCGIESKTLTYLCSHEVTLWVLLHCLTLNNIAICSPHILNWTWSKLCTHFLHQVTASQPFPAEYLAMLIATVAVKAPYMGVCGIKHTSEPAEWCSESG